MSGVLLITGGSRGIGAATARLALAQGYALAINFLRDGIAADRLIDELLAAGGTAEAFQADVADESDVVRLFSEVEARLGPPAALVNAAGIDGPVRRVAELEAAELKRLLAVNVVGTMLCCREAARRMSTAAGGPGGAIVNLSSMAATVGGRSGRSAYAASKAAVDAFTVGFAKEVAPEGIRVNAVRPGMTRTAMSAALERDPLYAEAVAHSIPMHRIAEPAEVAGPILFLLSEAASFITGALIDVSGGGFALGPPTRR